MSNLTNKLTSKPLISQASLELDIQNKLELRKPLVAVKNTRNLSKADMKLNDYAPFMECANL